LATFSFASPSGSLLKQVEVGNRSGGANQSQGPESSIMIGLFFRFYF